MADLAGSCHIAGLLIGRLALAYGSQMPAANVAASKAYDQGLAPWIGFHAG